MHRLSKSVLNSVAVGAVGQAALAGGFAWQAIANNGQAMPGSSVSLQREVDGIRLRCRRDRERRLGNPVDREGVSDVGDLVVRIVCVHQGVLLNGIRSGIGTRDA